MAPARTVQLRLGALAVELRLDEALSALWPAGSDVSHGPVDVIVALAAGPALPEEALAPFRPGAPLVARTSRLQRDLVGIHERIRGVCHPTGPALRRAVRLATQPALLRRGWVLLHATTVAWGGRVHVCVATSGTGKTTLARRVEAAGGEVWGDEVALVSANGEVAVHPGQPWSGLEGARGRLAALHLLGRGAPRRTPVRAAEAVARLTALQLVYEELPETAGLALAAAARLVTTAPVFATLVPDDDRAVRIVRDGEAG